MHGDDLVREGKLCVNNGESTEFESNVDSGHRSFPGFVK